MGDQGRKKELNSRHHNNSACEGYYGCSDGLQSMSIIEVQTRRRKRMWLKVISFFVAAVFFIQQVAYAWDYQPAANAMPAALATPGEGTVMPGTEEINVTNYDIFSRQRESGIAEELLPSGTESEQSRRFAPSYLKRQQSKHEEIIRQRMGKETLMERMKKGPRPEDIAEPIPLKKKLGGGGPPGGGMYYTLEDYGTVGPRQLNAYVYEDDNARTGIMTDMISYDVSHLDTSDWENNAEEMGEGDDTFIGSSTRVDSVDEIDPMRIIRQTVYHGDIKGEERIDYVLSNYDEDGSPMEVTIYDYDTKGGDNLDETRTYNIADLDIDFSSEDWKTKLSSDWKDQLDDFHLTRKTVYEGSEEEEKVVYALDTYVISDDDVNSPNKISVYDYEGEELKEVRSYYITDLGDSAEAQIRADDGKFDSVEREEYLDSISVYEGEKGKEKVQYTLSYFFEDQPGEYVPWERKDNVYDGNTLMESLTYDISELSPEDASKVGSVPKPAWKN